MVVLVSGLAWGNLLGDRVRHDAVPESNTRYFLSLERMLSSMDWRWLFSDVEGF